MPETSAQDTSAKEMVRLFGSSLAAAVAQALVLTIFISVAAGVAEVNLLLGGLVGLAFGVVAMGASLPHRLFGQQGFKVWIIEVGADVVSLVVAGVVIAALV
jgi:general stress protein CsbA